MSIAGQCPGCSRRFNAPDQFLGKQVKCPQCAHAFVFQAVSTPPAPARGPAVPSQNEPFPSPAASPNNRSRRNNGLLIAGVAVAFGLMFCLLSSVLGLWYLLRGGGDAQWKEFAPNGGGFTILMPVNPETKENNDQKILTSGRIKEASAQSAAKATYTVHYYDLPDRPINSHLYQTWLRNQLLTGGGKVVREQDVNQGGYSGREVMVDLPDDQVLVRRIYLAEARVFWVTAQYSRATPKASAEVQKFLDSFQITSVAKASTPVVVAELPTTRPNPKKDPPVGTRREPPVTKKEMPPPPPPPPDGFNLTMEERALMDAVNKFRADEKLPLFKPGQKLSDAARVEAKSAAEGKEAPKQDYGYQTTFRLTQPVRNLTAQQMMDLLVKNQALRTPFSSQTLTDIGVGVETGADGMVYNVILLGSGPK
ncbi:MAG: hypothetical protein K2R98_22625 [Gemmataceae bacterium]|nr:hypothetical protein [Gemmataceae bacterium]